jgi:predicted integral membrane protein DUF2269
MEWLGTLFLFLHIGGSIVAFGPTFAFPFIGARAAKEPMHGNFALRVNHLLVERVVEPGAAFVFLMGVGLIVTRGWNPFTELWLAAGILLFLLVFFYNLLVQLPRTKRMIELTSGPPPEGATGPPPEFVELAAKAARGGMLSTLGLIVILFLMVFKPF